MKKCLGIPVKFQKVENRTLVVLSNSQFIYPFDFWNFFSIFEVISWIQFLCVRYENLTDWEDLMYKKRKFVSFSLHLFLVWICYHHKVKNLKISWLVISIFQFYSIFSANYIVRAIEYSEKISTSKTSTTILHSLYNVLLNYTPEDFVHVPCSL